MLTVPPVSRQSNHERSLFPLNYAPEIYIIHTEANIYTKCPTLAYPTHTYTEGPAMTLRLCSCHHYPTRARKLEFQWSGRARACGRWVAAPLYSPAVPSRHSGLSWTTSPLHATPPSSEARRPLLQSRAEPSASAGPLREPSRGTYDVSRSTPRRPSRS